MPGVENKTTHGAKKSYLFITTIIKIPLDYISHFMYNIIAGIREINMCMLGALPARIP